MLIVTSTDNTLDMKLYNPRKENSHKNTCLDTRSCPLKYG